MADAPGNQKEEDTVALLKDLVRLQKEAAVQRQSDAKKKKSNTVAKVASLTAIGVITTAVSFLGAFTLRDFLQSLFEKFEFGQKNKAMAKLLYTTFVFVVVVGVLVALVYVKNAHSTDTSSESSEEK